MTRKDERKFARLIAEERAVWDARRVELITPGPVYIPMTADEAIILYGMAVRHLTGRVPIAASAAAALAQES